MKLLKFSKNLRDLLSNRKLTQQEFAKYLGTTQQTISRWLKGTNEPDLTTLLEICLLLGETPNNLLGFEDISDDIKNDYIKQSSRKDSTSN